MKTRKTKRGNTIRRVIAFLLCMTMVLGLGMQNVMEQVYAEEPVSTLTEESDTPAEESTEPKEDSEAGEGTEPKKDSEQGETTETKEESVITEEPKKDTSSDTSTVPGGTTPVEESSTDGNTTPATPNDNTTPAGTTETNTEASGSKSPAQTTPDGNTTSTITGEATTEVTDSSEVTEPEESDEKKVTELTYAAEDGSFGVTATALGEDVDLSGYELHAAQIQKDGEEADRYTAAMELVNGALEAETREAAELQVYDVWFTDTESGEKADLSGQVEISLDYTAPEFPEGTDAQLEVFCLNDGSAEAVEGTDTLAAGCELYALAWAIPADMTYETVVDGVKVIVKAGKDVLPEGAELSVEKVEEEETVQEIKKTVAKDVAANNATIKDMMVLDIRFYLNGQEIQPNGTVTVELENTGYEAENGISVYHVDDENTSATDMAATMSVEADVAFETTHFSNYVIIYEGNENATVTIEHYLKNASGHDEPIKLYRDFVKEFKSGTEESQITQFTKEDDDYALDSVVKINDNGWEEEVKDDEIIVDSTVTYRCYYTPETGTYKNGTTFFDYKNGGKDDRNSINWWGNYPADSNEENRLGTIGAANDYPLMVQRTVTVNGNKVTKRFNANAYWRIDRLHGQIGAGDSQSGSEPENNYTRDNETSGGDYANNPHDYSWPIITGLVTGLSGDKYENVDFACAEPGFFSAETKNGKTIYDDYNLVFVKNGNRYTLKSVEENGRTVCNDMNSFFPLNNKNNGQKNEYFGMRYDFTFSVGDYLGDMTYKFSGDDDLWVFLDGKLILDLGGIHGAYQGKEYNDKTNSLWPTEVDLWKVLTGEEEYTEEDKLNVNPDEKHTITVLYMERGGNASNCEMEFVMPNVQASDPIISTTPKAELSFTKIEAGTNSGISGAEFTLYSDKDCTQEIAAATSDSKGQVTFSNKLKEGRYYLKETAAPEGYLANSEIYTVVVTVTGDVATAVIKNSKEETITSISNTKAEKAIEKSKTAHVVDWDNRIYQIALSASSLMQSSIPGSTKAVDVMLVLDASGSMCEYSGSLAGEEVSKNSAQVGETYYFDKDGILYKAEKNHWGNWSVEYQSGSGNGEPDWDSAGWTEIPNILRTDYVTRNEAMRTAACEFADLLAEKSPESRIGIAAYTTGYFGGATLNEKLQLTSVNETGLTSIKDTINKIKANLGTKAYIGLDYANEQLKNSQNDKIVVLLSDGADDAEYDARNSANALKWNGATIYSVGFQVTRDTKEFLEDIAGDSERYFGADNMEALVNSFKLIVESTLEGTAIENAIVTDVIDSRFDVVDQDGKLLEEGTVIEDANGNEGVLHKNGSGEWYVEWSDISIAPKSKDGNLPGWSATIYVKAKEDYIGGNAVPTNADGSGITFSDIRIPFDKPTVNVKAELTISNKEVTVYKGDTLPTEQSIREDLFGSDYIGKYGVTASNFTWEWYDNPQCTGDPLKADAVGEMAAEADKTYYLKVTYDAGEPTDESNSNTTLEGQEHHAGDEKNIVTAINDGTPDSFRDVSGKAYGVYKIRVISGEIVIKKTLTEPAAEDQTFKFEITKDGSSYTHPTGTGDWTVEVLAGETEGTLEIPDLARGRYEITESAQEGYELQSVTIDTADSNGTNCQHESDTVSATFVLGYSTSKEDVIKNYTYTETDGGTKGAVTFKNASVIGNWKIVKKSSSEGNPVLEGAVFKLEKTDSSSEPGAQTKTTYYGKSGTDGTVKWYSDEACTKETTYLGSGVYTLSEIKAPVGYTLSDEKWTVILSNNQLTAMQDSDGNEISDTIEEGENGKEIHVFVFLNDALYDLPSAGGPGIYLYMLGGTLLMMAGTLLVYKKRKEEVLRG